MNVLKSAQPVGPGSSGRLPAIGIIEGDTMADFPGVNDFDGITLVCGSEFHCVEDNAKYCMKSDGTWIEQKEPTLNDYYTKTETDTVIGDAVNSLDVSSVGGTGKYLQSISEVDGKIIPVAETLDTVPTSSSQKPVTSDGVYTTIENTVNVITGRGTRIPTNGDCDSLTTNGVWYAENATHAGGISNAPFTTSGFLLYQQSWYQAIGSIIGIDQTAESIQSNIYYQRKRFYIYSGGVWSWTTWKTVITQSLT